jgi:hypothetical protein
MGWGHQDRDHIWCVFSIAFMISTEKVKAAFSKQELVKFWLCKYKEIHRVSDFLWYYLNLLVAWIYKCKIYVSKINKQLNFHAKLGHSNLNHKSFLSDTC